MQNATTGNLFFSAEEESDVQPTRPARFEPAGIILAKGSMRTASERRFVEAVCALYPRARVIERLHLPHNRIDLPGRGVLAQHYEGKKTLVLGVHSSAVRHSAEDGNACPNYWHFSPYGFCPYDCQYCYLAGTPGVKHSPTVKIFLNLPQMLARIEAVAAQLARPTAFYLGKLQDALALDPLTGYSRQMVPFFARQPYARLILLTKGAEVENLLDLEHRGRTIVSWSLNPPEISRLFERNVPAPAERLAAMRKCNEAGYPLRAVVMPIIPVEDWRTIYGRFLDHLLESVPLQRITLGQICSYAGARTLMQQKLGKDNPISNLLDHSKSADGRVRFPFDLRLRVYRYLIDRIRAIRSGLEIGLCLEEHRTFDALDMQDAFGRCNCVF